VAQVAGEVVAVLGTLAAKRNVRVETQIDPDLVALVDPLRLKQVLYNYLSNAIKFSREGAAVQVRARCENGDRLRVEVEDAGAGIPDAELGRLFTGLGLALVKRLVEAQGGTVGVSSQVGCGSLFYAILPS
jgi:signal transduction histidine kinase